MFQSQITWADYSSKTVNHTEVIDVELLDKKYTENVDKGKLIRELFALKIDIKAIRSDLAHFCFNLLVICFPDHPALADTSSCGDSQMEFSDLYACLDDSLSQSSSSSTSESDSFYLTKNPIEMYNVEQRSEAQIESDRQKAIKAGVKTEPVDESTPITSPTK